ncbi:MAG: hypothetical protein ACK4F6_14580 [Hylemonella sp.]
MSASDKIAIAAAFIAACAFAATLWQGHLARMHNRLSVRPLLVWVRDRAVTDAGTEIAFIVRNCGVGPAVIKSRHFTLDDKIFVPPEGTSDQVAELARTVFGASVPYQLRQHGLPGTDTAIPSGEHHVIAKIFFPNYRSETVDAILAQVGKIVFRIEYESLYKEPATLVAE